MIAVYKIRHGMEIVGKDIFFSLFQNSRTLEHPIKLMVGGSG